MEIGEIFSAIFSIAEMCTDLLKAHFLEMAFILIILYNLNTLLGSEKFSFLAIFFQAMILIFLVKYSDEISLSVKENTWISRITLGILPFYMINIYISQMLKSIKTKTKNKI